MGAINYPKVEYEKVKCNTEEDSDVFKSYFQKCSKNYSDFLASYFVIEGGVLKNEFRLFHAARVIED